MSCCALNYELRLLLPALAAAQEELLTDRALLVPFWSVFVRRVVDERLGRKEVAAAHEELCALVTRGLESREREPASAADVEDAVLRVLGELVLRMNEVTFKPVLAALIAWGAAAEGTPLRIPAFARVVQSLSASLKSLFTPYFAQIAPHLARHMAAAESSGRGAVVAAYLAVYAQDAQGKRVGGRGPL